MSDSKPNNAPKDNPFKLLADLCNEAVARHGSDWQAIERYVAGKLQNLEADDRTRTMLKIHELLKFVEPQQPAGSAH